MKRLIKKLLPKKALEKAIELRNTARLAAIPALPFDAGCLQKISDMKPLATIFSNREIEKLWQAANEKIAAVFKDGNYFGGVNPGDRRAVYYLITALKPSKVLEIGTHIGASTLYIAHAMKNLQPGATVTTVDIADVNDPANGAWKQLGLTFSPKGYAERLGCLKVISFVTAPSLVFMKDTAEKFDFIFLDGDHSSAAVYREVSASLPLLNDGGVILLHDYYPDAHPLFSDGNIIAGPFRALGRIIRENSAITVQPLAVLPWETKYGSCVTSLALITRRG